MKNLYPYITPRTEIVKIEIMPLLIISGGGSGDVRSVDIDTSNYDSDTDEIL